MPANNPATPWPHYDGTQAGVTAATIDGRPVPRYAEHALAALLRTAAPCSAAAHHPADAYWPPRPA